MEQQQPPKFRLSPKHRWSPKKGGAEFEQGDDDAEQEDSKTCQKWTHAISRKQQKSHHLPDALRLEKENLIRKGDGSSSKNELQRRNPGFEKKHGSIDAGQQPHEDRGGGKLDFYAWSQKLIHGNQSKNENHQGSPVE